MSKAKLERAARRAAELVLDAARLGPWELEVSFVDDASIRALNEQWRGKDAATDVLSFAAHEGEAMPGTEHFLGDVVISLETALRQASELRHPFAHEVAVLVAHGALHLLGFDHELGAREARRQCEAEMGWLDSAGVAPELALSRRGSLGTD
jgi:probable rRNA maturation factor